MTKGTAANAGTQIRNLRLKRGLSQANLAELCDVGIKTVCNWERNHCLPATSNWRSLAEALKIRISDLCEILHNTQVPGDIDESSFGLASGKRWAALLDPETNHHREGDDTDRRQLLTGAAGAIASTAAMGPAGLLRGESGASAAQGVDAWMETAWSYCEDYEVVAKTTLLPALLEEIDGLQNEIRTSTESDQRRLYSPLARLYVATASAMGSIGYSNADIRKWWSAAQQASNLTSDDGLRAWVLGAQSNRGVWLDLATPSRTLRWAQESLDLVGGNPSCILGATGAKNGLVAQAHVYAMLGRKDEATRSLEDLHRLYERWGTLAGNWLNGFVASGPHQTDGFVWSHLGNLSRAESSQALALADLPRGASGQMAMIQLQKATALVRSGDLAGISHALQALEHTEPKHRTKVVMSFASSLLDWVPSTELRRTDVVQYREYLGQVA